MLVPEFFDNYRSGNLSSKKFFCNEQKITEGLEAFTEAYYNSSIKADTQDRPTAEAMVTPNCVKNVPEVPGIKVTGINTAINTSVQETTATDTSFIA